MNNKEIQKQIELKWNSILNNEPTEENCKEAYDEIYSYFLRSKGTISDNDLTFIAKVFIKFIGSNNKILEIGCGDGLFSRKLADKNNDVVGIDVSKIAIDIANKNKNSKLNIKYLCGDARKLNFENNHFDIVVSMDVVEHIPPQEIINHFNEVNRVIKSGGYYLFWTPHKYYSATSLGLHLKEYTLKEIVDILNKSNFQPFIFGYFSNIKVRNYMIMYEKILYKTGIYKIGKFVRPVKLLIPPLCIYAQKIDK